VNDHAGRFCEADTGAPCSRGETSGPMGVAGRCVITRADRILLVQRAAGSFDAGLWELPGGKSNYGEGLGQAVEREVAEETGLRVEIGRPFVVWHLTREPYWVTGVTFLCERWSGEVVLSREHDDFSWLTLPAAQDLPLATTVIDQLEAYAALLKTGEGR